MSLIISANIEGISTRVDNTIKITLGTQEVSAEQVGSLYQLRNKLVKVLLSDTNINQAEIKATESVELDADKKKSPSKRLRAVLFIQWQQVKSNVDFERYYESKMNELINHFKSKLEPNV